MESFSVSQFIEFLNAALGTAVFPAGVAVEGEIIEYRVSQGKWIWFGLKDETSVVWCFATVWGLRQPLENGMQIRAYGRPKVHLKSGKFSLNVDKAEAVGHGALQRSFELLKSKLESEGIFSSERKRSLSKFPSRIGLIASSESAAYGDFMRILGNRWGGVDIELADVRVQGKDAVGQIVSAISYFNKSLTPVDLLVLIRGGGSLEDLQAFNSEDVCRMVFASKLPIVVGVGHERDKTLADMAADCRASTPSNAAEVIFPNKDEIQESLESSSFRITIAMENCLWQNQEKIGHLIVGLESGLRQPSAAVEKLVNVLEQSLYGFVSRLSFEQQGLSMLSEKLSTKMDNKLINQSLGLSSKKRILDGLSPHRLLCQGYSVVRHKGKIVRSSTQVGLGQDIKIQLAKGDLVAGIKSKK